MQVEHEAMLERRGQAFCFTIALLSPAGTGPRFGAGETAQGTVALAVLGGLGGLVA